MSKRVLFVVTLTALSALVVSELDAGYPFDRSRIFRRPSASAKHTVKPLLRRMPRTLEQMTALYGPSILVREGIAMAKKAEFVTQPK